MRTNKNITEIEKSTYNAFCQQHHILNDDSPAAIRNGEHIGGYIAHTWNENIDERTLKVALEQLRDRLVFIPVEQTEVADILAHLDQSQRNIVANWLSRQSRLETDNVKGFSNVSLIVSWLINRRYAISEEGLTMALGNVQNNSKRKLYWKELPKADRSIVGGRINHSLVNKSEEGFAPRASTNRTARQIAKDNRAKNETPLTPVSINIEYQAKAESLVGRSHGQTDQARKLFVMVPGTSTIDWQQTHAARERFLNTQVPLTRR